MPVMVTVAELLHEQGIKYKPERFACSHFYAVTEIPPLDKICRYCLRPWNDHSDRKRR